MHGKLDALLRSSGRFERWRERSRYATVAAMLCASASLFLLLTALLLDEAELLTVLTLAGLGLCLAGFYLALPWERLPRVWVVAAPAGAILLAAAAAVAIDPSYGFYLVFIAGFTAYTFEDRRVILGHLGLIALALAAPIALVPDSTREALAAALIYGPGVILLAGLAAYIRDRTDARERAYRQFAEDALALAWRIRTHLGNEEPWFERPEPPPPRGTGTAVGLRPRLRGAHSSRPRPGPRRGPVRSRVVLVSVVIAAVVSVAGVLGRGATPVSDPSAEPPLGLTDRGVPPGQPTASESPRDTDASPDERDRRHRDAADRNRNGNGNGNGNAPGAGSGAGPGSGAEAAATGEPTPVAAPPAAQNPASGSIADAAPPAEAPETESRSTHEAPPAQPPSEPSESTTESSPIPPPPDAPSLNDLGDLLEPLGLERRLGTPLSPSAAVARPSARPGGRRADREGPGAPQSSRAG